MGVDQQVEVIQNEAIEHGLVHGLPQQSRTQPATKRDGDIHGLAKSTSPRRATSTKSLKEGESTDSLWGVSSMNTHDKKERLWQSVSDLGAQTPQGAGDEFADQLETEEMDGQTRRHFMGIMGASMAMASMSGCVRRPVEKIMPYSKQPEHAAGVTTHYATANIGQDVVGLLVESNDGRPTKIEGNPFHGWSVGGTSAAHQAMVLDLYDPLRLTTPRKANALTWNATEKFVKRTLGASRAMVGRLVVFSDAVPSPALSDFADGSISDIQGQWFFYDSISADNEREG